MIWNGKRKQREAAEALRKNEERKKAEALREMEMIEKDADISYILLSIEAIINKIINTLPKSESGERAVNFMGAAYSKIAANNCRGYILGKGDMPEMKDCRTASEWLSEFNILINEMAACCPKTDETKIAISCISNARQIIVAMYPWGRNQKYGFSEEKAQTVKKINELYAELRGMARGSINSDDERDKAIKDLKESLENLKWGTEHYADQWKETNKPLADILVRVDMKDIMETFGSLAITIVTELPQNHNTTQAIGHLIGALHVMKNNTKWRLEVVE